MRLFYPISPHFQDAINTVSPWDCRQIVHASAIVHVCAISYTNGNILYPLHVLKSACQC